MMKGFGAAPAASAGGFGAFGASTGASAGGFGAPAGNTGGFGAGGFGAASSGAGFGAAPAGASTGGFGFGAAAAPAASSGGFGSFGASTGASTGGFGAATGGFGAAAPAASSGGFGAFGASTGASTGGFGGGFGAGTGGFGAGGFGASGASSAGGFGFGAGGFGAPAQGGFGQPVQQQPQQPQPPQKWPDVEWKSKFEKLPELLKAKMNQHKCMVEDCRSRNEEIKNILKRRAANFAASPAQPFAADVLPDGARPPADAVEDVKTERVASRLRHCLASLKSSLEHDSWQLQRQQEHISREKQMLSSVRSTVRSADAGSSAMVSGADAAHSHDRSLGFLQDLGRELHEEIQHLKDVMLDLEGVLAGSVQRPSQYPPELIEQVLWQTERLWHAMSAKAALLHAQAQRSRHDFTGLLRAVDPSARNPLAQRETITLVLQVAVTGLKFNAHRFIEALAGKCAITTNRLHILQVDPMHNAVIVCVEDGAQQGFPSEQVGNTLRRLFTQADLDLATAPLFCFSLQVGRDQPIIHPAASPHLDDAEGLDADMVAEQTQTPQALPAPAAPATGGAFGGATGGAFGATGFGAAAKPGGFGFGAATGAAPATSGFGFGSTAGSTAGGFGAAASTGFGAKPTTGGFGAPAASTGGFGASTGGFGASTGGFGASTGGFGASTGGFGAAPAAGGFAAPAFGAGAFGAGFGSTAQNAAKKPAGSKKSGFGR